MNANQILAKSDKGRDEIKVRTQALSQHQRNLLIAADGQRTAGELAQMYSKIPDVPGLIDALIEQGLLEVLNNTAIRAAFTTAELMQARMTRATQYMSETANANLGLGAFLFTMKVNKCATLDQVRALVPEYQSALTKKRGTDTAEALTAKLLEILK